MINAIAVGLCAAAFVVSVLEGWRKFAAFNLLFLALNVWAVLK